MAQRVPRMGSAQLEEERLHSARDRMTVKQAGESTEGRYLKELSSDGKTQQDMKGCDGRSPGDHEDTGRN